MLFQRMSVLKGVFAFLCMVVSCGSVFAGDAVKLMIELGSNEITTSEYIDVIVTAVDADGNKDMEFVKDVAIEVEGFAFGSSDVELPLSGIYTFLTSDQGRKPFNKGLRIKQPGEYTVIASDLFDEIQPGKATIKVTEEGGGVVMGTLQVDSPFSGEVVSDAKVDLVASTSIPSSPIVVYIDEERVSEGLSDADGKIVMQISGIEEGEHTLLVNAVDFQGTVVATSSDIPFIYEKPDHGALFVGLEILPDASVIVGDKVTFKVSTSQHVESVTIRLADGEFLPTKKESDGVFVKDLLTDEVGSFPIDLKLAIDGTTSEETDIDNLLVSPDIKKILTASYMPNTAENKADIVWTFTGRVDYFKLQYGLDESDLDLSLTSTVPNGTIYLKDPTKTRYAQIFPVDEAGIVVGEPSSVLVIDPLRDPDPVCGNGFIEEGEECDDGNGVNSDGCSAICRLEIALCGNRRIEIGEECDDGNTRNGDGCSRTCKIETSICGNGVLEQGEECDDGNILETDTCSNACTIIVEIPEPPVIEPIFEEVIEEEIEEEEIALQTCNPGNISLGSKVISGRYYIYRDPVENATSYKVYRRETKPTRVSSMQIVGETDDTLFEYPFNPSAEVDQYAWYAVEAVCENFDQKLIGDFTKLKVGPKDTLLFLLLIGVLGGAMRTLKRQKV